VGHTLRKAMIPSCLWTSFLADLLRGPSLGGKGGKLLSLYLAASYRPHPRNANISKLSLRGSE
jgi:hypothetical protein